MINIVNADCVEYLKTIPNESVDLVVTDPPYRVIAGGHTTPEWIDNYGTTVLHKNDGKIFEHNDVDHRKWLKEVYRVLKQGTHFYMMTNVLNMFELKQIAEDVGFVLHNVLVWEKNTANANRWYMKNCEYTLFFRKGIAKTINDCGSKTVHQFNNIVGNKLHETEKPVELMKYYVKNSSNEGGYCFRPVYGFRCDRKSM